MKHWVALAFVCALLAGCTSSASHPGASGGGTGASASPAGTVSTASGSGTTHPASSSSSARSGAATSGSSASPGVHSSLSAKNGAAVKRWVSAAQHRRNLVVMASAAYQARKHSSACSALATAVTKELADLPTPFAVLTTRIRTAATEYRKAAQACKAGSGGVSALLDKGDTAARGAVNYLEQRGVGQL